MAIQELIHRSGIAHLHALQQLSRFLTVGSYNVHAVAFRVCQGAFGLWRGFVHYPRPSEDGQGKAE